jgi:hypothetical protein
VTRRVLPRDEAVAISSIGEKYKAEIIASIPQSEDGCIAKAISPTCAAARTCRRPAS